MEPVRLVGPLRGGRHGGFRGIGLWHADVEHQLQTRTLREMRAIFDDAGLEYLEVEFLADFFVDPGEPARAESDRLRRQLFDTAAAFDAHHIKVGNIPGTPCELGRLTEEFAALCRDAAEHTDAKVAYESMPFDVNVNTLEAAVELAVGAGAAQRRPRDRHLAHGQARDLTRRPASGSRSSSSSGSSCRTGSRRRWRTRSTRRSTTGGCRARASSTSPVTSQALQDLGYPGPWGVEVLSAELRSLPIEEEFRRAYETTLAQFRAGVA